MRELGWAIVLAVLFCFAVPGVIVMLRGEPQKSELRRLADRITVIRSGGSESNGVHMLSDSLKISEEDYALMGADNSCAKRNFPNVSRDEREEGRWFAGADDLDGTKFGNANATCVRREFPASWASSASRVIGIDSASPCISEFSVPVGILWKLSNRRNRFRSSSGFAQKP